MSADSVRAWSRRHLNDLPSTGNGCIMYASKLRAGRHIQDNISEFQSLLRYWYGPVYPTAFMVECYMIDYCCTCHAKASLDP
jgi:hypothetical protein